MRIIFLDFDGVILTLRTATAYKAETGRPGGWSRSKPDPLVCEVLRACCRLGVKIVVSSTWRDMGQARDRVLYDGQLIEHLHDDPYTTLKSGPSVQAHDDRPYQVAEWLGRHPEVTDYRILDDDPWNWTPEQAARFIKCDAHDGLGGIGMHELLLWAKGENKQKTTL